MKYLSLLLVLASVSLGSSITCLTCDSFVSCTNPVPEFCPPRTVCYTIREGGKPIYKGCTSGCSMLPAANHFQRECSVCDTDRCNGDDRYVNIGHSNNFHNHEHKRKHPLPYEPFDRRRPRNLGGRAVHIEKASGEIGSGVGIFEQDQEIGRGVVVNKENGIGEGVIIDRPQGNQHRSGIGRGAVLSNNNENDGLNSSNREIGNGASLSERRLGSGTSLSQPGIGHGVQSMKRRSIGHGAKPNHNYNSNNIGSGVGIGHGIGSGVSGSYNSNNIGSGVGYGYNIGSGASSSHHSSRSNNIGSGVGIGHNIQSGSSGSHHSSHSNNIGSGVGIGHSIGSGVSGSHPSSHSNNIGSGVGYGHNIGSGASSAHDHRKLKHHKHRDRRSERNTQIGGNIGGGVVPNDPYHPDHYHNNPDIGHGVRPKSAVSISTYISMITVFIVTRFLY